MQRGLFFLNKYATEHTYIYMYLYKLLKILIHTMAS